MVARRAPVPGSSWAAAPVARTEAAAIRTRPRTASLRRRDGRGVLDGRGAEAVERAEGVAGVPGVDRCLVLDERLVTPSGALVGDAEVVPHVGDVGEPRLRRLEVLDRFRRTAALDQQETERVRGVAVVGVEAARREERGLRLVRASERQERTPL